MEKEWKTVFAVLANQFDKKVSCAEIGLKSNQLQKELNDMKLFDIIKRSLLNFSF